MGKLRLRRAMQVSSHDEALKALVTVACAAARNESSLSCMDSKPFSYAQTDRKNENI